MNNNTVASPSMSVVKTPQIINTTDSNLFFQVFTNLASFFMVFIKTVAYFAQKRKGTLKSLSFDHYKFNFLWYEIRNVLPLSKDLQY